MVFDLRRVFFDWLVWSENVMRDLTPEELKLAPDWATHYTVHELEFTPHCICFYGSRLHKWVYHKNGGNWSPEQVHNKIPAEAAALHFETFDITKHDFSDWEISSADFEHDEFTIRFFEVNAIHLNKDDAIAIAKSLGVTGEDLK